MRASTLVLTLVSATAVLAAGSPVIDLGHSRYRGSYNETSNVTSYEGIRFAASPSGMLSLCALP